FFFFQAEDGIRDYKVTGVQTCALPISWHRELVGHADPNHEPKGLGSMPCWLVVWVSVPDKLPVPGFVPSPIVTGMNGSGWLLLRSEERRVGKEGRLCRAGYGCVGGG